MTFRSVSFVLMAVSAAAALSACSSGAQPRYAGTAAGNSRGVIAPGQTVVSQYQPSVFGAPAELPQTIRALAPPAPAQPLFGTAADTGVQYGFDSQGRQNLAEGDASRAEFNFEKALEVNPFDPVALNNLAVAKAERGQFYEAMSLLDRAAKLAPDNSDVIANLARLRGYVQSYATAGAAPAPGVAARSLRGAMPPTPPPLWGAASSASPRPAAAPRASAPASSDYYVSKACRSVTRSNGQVELVCDQAR